MTQIDKIKAEIERLMNWKPKAIPSGMRQRDVLNIRKGVLLTLKAFINSLPAEQPSEDLEKASYHAAMELMNNTNFTPKTILGQFISMLQGLFKSGADWQKEQLINKTCEWLKENIYNRVYKCNDGLGFPTAAFLEEFKKAMEDK